MRLVPKLGPTADGHSSADAGLKPTGSPSRRWPDWDVEPSTHGGIVTIKPKANPTNRTATIKAAATPEELRRMQDNAAAAGMKPSEYVRARCVYDRAVRYRSEETAARQEAALQALALTEEIRRLRLAVEAGETASARVLTEVERAGRAAFSALKGRGD